MGIQLDSKKANGKTIAVNYEFTDIEENYTLFLDNSVLNYWTNSTFKDLDLQGKVVRIVKLHFLVY